MDTDPVMSESSKKLTTAYGKKDEQFGKKG